MVVGITELGINDHQALEVVSYSQSFRHAHAAMELYSVLTDEARGLADEVFQSVNSALGFAAALGL